MLVSPVVVRFVDTRSSAQAGCAKPGLQSTHNRDYNRRHPGGLGRAGVGRGGQGRGSGLAGPGRAGPGRAGPGQPGAGAGAGAGWAGARARA